MTSIRRKKLLRNRISIHQQQSNDCREAPSSNSVHSMKSCMKFCRSSYFDLTTNRQSPRRPFRISMPSRAKKQTSFWFLANPWANLHDNKAWHQKADSLNLEVRLRWTFDPAGSISTSEHHYQESMVNRWFNPFSGCNGRHGNSPIVCDEARIEALIST